MRILRLVSVSRAAKEIVVNRAVIEKSLSSKPRLVWPLATVARLMGISPSLLRKWANLGLITLYQRPTAHHRPGLTRKAIHKFLAELAEESASILEIYFRRPRPAEAKCLKAICGLQKGDIFTPAEFAARAGVATTTVHRLIACHVLDVWYPTPHRPKICNYLEKERRKRLTRKLLKKRR